MRSFFGCRTLALKSVAPFVGAIAQLFPQAKVSRLSKNVLSNRLKEINWRLFRDVYNHLPDRYQRILGTKEVKSSGQFQQALRLMAV